MRKEFGLAALALLATSCSLNGGLPAASLMMRDAALASGSIRSAHVALVTDGAVPGLPVQRLEADITTENGGGAAGSIAPVLGAPIDFAQVRDALYTKTSSGAFTRSTTRVLDATNLLDPHHGLAHLLADIQHPTTIARQRRLGIDSFEVTGGLPAADIAHLLPGATTAATITTWLRVEQTHIPVDTTLTFPSDGSTLDIKVSDIDKKMTITTPE
ncbi:LppX_LprAFG lipoprotein [Nocardia alni]|uniref:LppX_LprAFG lipoprotein n=1 Tax=Nocardia alni TaxID=2815723 RepID=UPI001C24416C|nr:LppX_LprAFG lipoprotein [Nocardia alni]